MGVDLLHVAAALRWYLHPDETKGNNTFVRIPQQPRSHTAQCARLKEEKGGLID